MIAAISANGFLSELFGTSGASRTRSVGPRFAPGSDNSREEISPTGARVPVDTVELSPLGRELSETERTAGQLGHDHSRGDAGRGPQPTQPDEIRLDHAETRSPNKGGEGEEADRPGDTSLKPEEEKEARQLKQRDQEVRRHEQAHKAAAGSLASGGPSFEYQTGPDGRRYAVGGEVNIDTSAIPGDPRATIAKMQQVRRAAMAPANPSGQDRSVAAKAAAMEQKARAELNAQRAERQEDADADTAESNPTAASTEVGPATTSTPGPALRLTDQPPSVPAIQLQGRLDVLA